MIPAIRKNLWILTILALFSLTACVKGGAHSELNAGDAPVQGASSPSYGSGGVPLAAGEPSAGEAFSAIPTQKLVKVGLLVPLSGKSATLGRALQDAAVLALFDKYAGLSTNAASTKVELITKDTRDTPSAAREAFAEAVKEGATMVIGPVYSDAVTAVAPDARAAGIPLLSLSNNQAVAAPGIYTLGFDPEAQIRRVVQFAYSNGLFRIGVLAPDNAYGHRVVDSLNAIADGSSRKIKPAVFYPAGNSSVNVGVEAFAKEAMVDGKPALDALLIAESGDKLGALLTALGNKGINPKNVQFLGTGLWDDVELIRNHDVSGAIIASSPADLTQKFETRFRKAYNYAPPRIASLTYDAVALLTTLATSPGGLDQRTLLDASGFVGPANGNFRILTNGRVERGLAVLQIKDGSFVEVDGAPSQFAPAVQ